MRLGVILFWLAAAQAFAAAPSLSQGGVVNAASYTAQLAPGEIVSIFGMELASGTVSATALPLPMSLLGTSVNFGGKPAALIFVSKNQINAQVPVDVAPGALSVNVTTPEGSSGSVSVQIVPEAPALFTVASTGYGPVAAQHADGSAVNGASPARAGEVVILYATGLGAVRSPVATGAPATGANPITGQARVTIGGKVATVDYAGLAPGFVGLYQVNVRVPDGVLPGDLLSLVTVVPAAGGGAGRTAASNPVVLGEAGAGGRPRFLPFPAEAQNLGAPSFLAAGDVFLAYDGTTPCVRITAFYRLHDSPAGTILRTPERSGCLTRNFELQTAPAQAGQPATTRLMFPTFALEASPGLANGLLAIDAASGNMAPVILPSTLSADRFDGNALNAAGANLVAPGRKADGSGGAGMVVMAANSTIRAIPNPSGPTWQYLGGPQLFDAANQFLYTGASSSATGPFNEIVELNMRPNAPAAAALFPPAGLSGAATGRWQLNITRDVRQLFALTRDGSTTSPSVNFRIYDLAAGTASAIALPSGLTPALQGTGNARTPAFFFSAQDQAVFIPTVGSTNAELVTGLITVDQLRLQPIKVLLPAGVRDLSEVDQNGGTIYGLMNASTTGAAEGVLAFDRTDGFFTLFKAPAGTVIGRGQAGKQAVRGPIRSYAFLPARQVIVAPGSKSDPSVADAGMVVFNLNGSARVIPLPANVARLHSSGNPFLKAATNKVFMMAQSTAAPAGVADVLVWFDLGANTSGSLALPTPATALVSVDYDPGTGMAVGTVNPEAKGYAVWLLP